MRPHTIENIMYRITHIQSLVHIEVLLLIQWEDDSQYDMFSIFQISIYYGLSILHFSVH